MYLYGNIKKNITTSSQTPLHPQSVIIAYFVKVLLFFSAAILEDINPVVSLRATLHLGTIHDNAIKTLVW
jgi:hypothetical protein